MRKLLNICALIVISTLSGGVASGQKVTVINHFYGDTTHTGPEQFILAGTSEHRYIVNHYTVREEQPEARVLQLIDFSLSFYLDEMLDWSSPTVFFRRTSDENFARMNEIVKQSLSLYGHPAEEAFWGFSGRMEKQLLALHQLAGRTIDYNQPSLPATTGRVGHYTLQRQLIDLKSLATRELEELLEDHPAPIDTKGRLLTGLPDKTTSTSTNEEKLLRKIDDYSPGQITQLIDSLFELDEVPHGLIASINEKISKLDAAPEPVFRKNQPLELMDFEIETEPEPDSPKLLINIPDKDKPVASATPVTSGQDAFNERILQLLEQNNRLMEKYNDRFEDMQTQIDQLKSAPVVNNESESRLQRQIDEIHTMISDLKSGNSGTQGSASGSKLKPVELIFSKNSAEISLQHQVILNEVIAGLLRNTAYKIMITGYADRTGNAEHNVLLSRLRAQRVRDYLSQGGVREERMILNYLGDHKSDSANPLDRKVEIEYLVDFTAAGR